MEDTHLPIPIQDGDKYLSNIGCQNHEENHNKKLISLPIR